SVGAEQGEEAASAEIVEVMRVAVQRRGDGHRGNDLTATGEQGGAVFDQLARARQVFDGFQADDAVEFFFAAKAFGIGADISEVGPPVMRLGEGDCGRVDIHADYRLVR